MGRPTDIQPSPYMGRKQHGKAFTSYAATAFKQCQAHSAMSVIVMAIPRASFFGNLRESTLISVS